ncbi:hypothetical protein TNCV_3163761 [Trichonephila clavipes]|nr:hypothetical protein TNCV_3163761 [Trichonephila clavipes]
MVKNIARKRKRPFYGNKFTNTSKNSSTSAVPKCTASCSKLRNESFSTAEEMPGPGFGNRIVDLELIVEAFAQLCYPKCFAKKVELFEDSRYGLCSHFTLKFGNRAQRNHVTKGMMSPPLLRNDMELGSLFLPPPIHHKSGVLSFDLSGTYPSPPLSTKRNGGILSNPSRSTKMKLHWKHLRYLHSSSGESRVLGLVSDHL